MTINGGTGLQAWNGESCPSIHAVTHTRTGLKGQEMKNKHGSNQSVDTKFATVLVDDAITFIESGRVDKGLALMQRVLTLLPDIGLERQEEYFKKHAEIRAHIRGFQ